ncbi:bifunctional metallophosphatase/5'-nucleotidase [Corynebacterium lubricantis]|uniref:bifunctional metallophosphatase/5'-nucleotidase n=1 Tax=Corynebacterium lubricantis TaxID=541095 RepID=UPI00037810E0|nr:bifunctional UDP-sugar hydrolase/5'-nucleotidase [Corynebacterium lubricantis]
MSKFRRLGHLVAATTTTALVMQGFVVANAQEDASNEVTISISNFTDFHGYLEDEIKYEAPEAGQSMGAANIASLIEYVNAGADGSIATTTGDNVGGSAFVSAIANDEPTIEALNAMGIEVNAAGNHEFDKGFDDLTGRLIPGFDSPILGANVYFEDGTRALEASMVKEIDGVKVGIVGTTSNLTPQKVSPSATAGLDIRNASEEANKEAKRLKDSGEADIVVVLQHDPAEIDNLNMDAAYVDFLFGGDTHLRQLDIDAAVPYAQSWEYGKMVTDLDITYNKDTNEIVNLTAEQYDAADFVTLGLTPNAEVAAIVDNAVAQSEVLGAEVIAETTESFYRGSNPGAGPGSNRGVESTANNMLAESNLQAMDAFLGGGQIDLGLMNAGGVRADLPAGEVTVEHAVNMQPFGNELSYATLSGQAILDALENQWQDGNERPRLSMGVSDNVNYVYDPSAPKGSRMTHVTINGEALDPNRDYKVATSTFMFEGGDGFINPADVRDQVNVGYIDFQAFQDYLRTGAAAVRQGQGEVGVVLPEGGLVSGASNTIEVSSLNYSSEDEPMATTVTLRIGDVEQTVGIDTATSDADNGYGEFGRATVIIDLPAEVTGEQLLTITTDAGTEISMPVNVDEELSNGGTSRSSSSSLSNLSSLSSR